MSVLLWHLYWIAVITIIVVMLLVVIGICLVAEIFIGEWWANRSGRCSRMGR